MIGQLIQERFRLDARLGRWCGSEAYRAMDLERQQPVLIRILPQALAINENLWTQLVSRGQRVAAIDHPGVLKLLSLGRDAGVAYLVQRYVQAKPLSEMWQTTGEPLAREQALAFVRQIATALDAIHAAGLVHGALSPGCILVDSNSGELLLDGLLTASMSGDAATLELTAAYAAPEQLGPGTGAPAADLYALGVLAFEWLAGQNPYASAGASAATLHNNHVIMPVPELTRYDRTLPLTVNAAFRELLHKDPERRPASGAALIARLERALSGQGIGRRTPAWVWSLLGALTALLLVVGAGWAILRDGGLEVVMGRLWGGGEAEPPVAALTTTASPTVTLAATLTLAPAPVQSTATPSLPPSALPTTAPEPTATLAVTAEPTNTPPPTPTITPSPTATAVSPTATLTPLPVTLSCTVEPGGPLADLWQAHKLELGCPLEVEPIAGWWATEPFENGRMFWSEDAGLFLALVGGDSGTWAWFPDDSTAWQEGMDEKTCDPGTPPGLELPIRGFGKIWCENAALRSAMGWATADERGVEQGIMLLQRFERGYLLRDADGSETGRVYVLRLSDYTFVRAPY